MPQRKFAYFSCYMDRGCLDICDYPLVRKEFLYFPPPSQLASAIYSPLIGGSGTCDDDGGKRTHACRLTMVQQILGVQWLTEIQCNESTNKNSGDIGLIGLAVMGQNLILNAKLIMVILLLLTTELFRKLTTFGQRGSAVLTPLRNCVPTWRDQEESSCSWRLKACRWHWQLPPSLGKRWYHYRWW